MTLPFELVGKLVEVKFHDHAGTGQKIVDCVVWGKLFSLDEKQIVIQQWEAPEGNPGDQEYITLVWGAVFEINPLVKKG